MTVKLAWSRTHGDVERQGDPPDGEERLITASSAGPGAGDVGGGNGGVPAANSLFTDQTIGKSQDAF